MAYNPLPLHDSIGNNTWEQTWKRVFVVDTLSNIGIDRGNKQMADGEGHPSPFIVGLTQLGVSGGQKLYFGYKENYIRQIRKGILEFGAVKLVANTISLRKIIGDDVSIDNLSTQNIYAHTGKFDSLNKIENLEFGEIKGKIIGADTATLSKINFGTLSGKEITTDQLHIENLILNNLIANDIKSNYKIKSQIGDFITVSTNLIKTGTFNVDYLNVNNHLNVDSLSAKSIEANELHTNLSILGTLQAVSIICSNLQTINFEMPQEITLSKLNTNVISANGAVINNIAGTEIYGVNFKGTNLSSSTVRTTNFWSKTQTVSKSVISQLSVLSTAKIKTLSSNQIKGYSITTQFGTMEYFNSNEACIYNFSGDDLLFSNGEFNKVKSATVSASDFKGITASLNKIIGTTVSIDRVIGNNLSISVNIIANQLSVLSLAKIKTLSSSTIQGQRILFSSGNISNLTANIATIVNFSGDNLGFNVGNFNTKIKSPMVSATTVSSDKFKGTTVSAGLVKGTNASLGLVKSTTASSDKFKGTTVSAGLVKGTNASLGLVKSTTASSDKFKGTTVSAGLVKGTNASLGTFRGSTASMSNFKGGTASLNTFKGGTASTNTVKGLSIYATQWLRSTNISASTKIITNQLSTLSTAKIKTLSTNKVKGTNVSVNTVRGLSIYSTNWLRSANVSANYLKSSTVSGNTIKSINLSVSTKIMANQLSVLSIAKIKTLSSNQIKGTTVSMDKVKGTNVSANAIKGVSLQGFDNVMVWF